MTLNRLSDPFSKLGVSKWVPTVHGPAFASLALHHFYRALGWLAEHKDALEQHLFERVRDLFHLKLDLVFWDITSTYFEGSGPEVLARAFRKMKSGLDLRPIYHYRDSRVRGHVMICFLAFLLESTFQRHCQEKEITVPYNDLLLDLKQVRAFELKLNDKRYLFRSSLYGKSCEDFRAVGLRLPSEVTELP